MTLSELLNRIQRELGKQWNYLGTELVYNKLIDAYKDLYNNENFSFFLKDDIIKLNAYRDLNVNGIQVQPDYYIVSYYEDPQSVIVCDDTYRIYWPLDEMSYKVLFKISNGQIAVEPKLINITGFNVPQKAKIYKHDYELPMDCAFNKEAIILDLTNKRSIPKTTSTIMAKYELLYSNMTYNYPFMYKTISRSIGYNTNNYITFMPIMFNNTYNLKLHYYRKPFEGFDSDNIFYDISIDIPEEFSNVLMWATLEQCFASTGDNRLGYALQKKDYHLHELLKRNNGDEAIIRIMEEYPPYGEDELFTNGIVNVSLV